MNYMLTFKLVPTGKPYNYENPEPGSRLSPKILTGIVENAIKAYISENSRQEWWELKDFQASYDRSN